MRPGLYADDSITRRVNRENVLMLGGGRALLMQLAHPKVAAGVDEHSDFRKRPMYRLRRTIRLTMAIVFGDRETALAAARSVNRVHQHVRGESYSALDTDLLLWVHATMVDTALATYETFVHPLPPDEREAQEEEPGEGCCGEDVLEVLRHRRAPFFLSASLEDRPALPRWTARSEGTPVRYRAAPASCVAV